MGAGALAQASIPTRHGGKFAQTDAELGWRRRFGAMISPRALIPFTWV